MFTVLREGLRIFSRARRAKHGFRRYDGDPEKICQQIIEDTFDKQKKYFRVSAGHFCEFYVRDFAFCCEALVELGYAEQVKSTLRYALSRFAAAGKVTTSISPSGVAFDFPSYGPDSLALLLYSLTHTRNAELAREYRALLQQEVNKFAKKVVDPKTLLPYAHKRFSSIRDHAKRRASCYDAVMIGIVAREVGELGLHFPYHEKQIVEKLIATYWNGTYFFEDITKQNIVVGDANVFPFWSELVKDEQMLEDAMNSIDAAELSKPFPLRYVNTIDKHREKIGLHVANWFASEYETDSIWIHLGLCYLQVHYDERKIDEHLDQYTALIEQYGTFLEVYDNNGKPFKTSFYVTDEAMVWCANYLILKKTDEDV